MGPDCSNQRPHHHRAWLTLILAALPAAGCTGADTRTIDGDAGAADALADADRDGDGGSAADADVANDADRASLSCELIPGESTIHEGDEPVRVHSLVELSIGHYALSVSVGPETAAQAEVWILDGINLHPLNRSAIAGVEELILGYSVRDGNLIALGRSGETVTFYQWFLGTDWELGLLTERHLCDVCRPSLAPPLPGLGRAAVATSGIDGVVHHVVPYLLEEPILSSATLPGTSPIVVRGAFGPLLLADFGGLVGASFHWDGELASEVTEIAPAHMTAYAAANTVGDDVLIATTESSDTLRMVIYALEGVAGSASPTAFDGFAAPGIVNISTNHDVALVAGQAPDSPDAERATTWIAVLHTDPVEALMGLTVLGANEPMFDWQPRPGVAAAPYDSGHAIVWASQDRDRRALVRARFVACRRD